MSFNYEQSYALNNGCAPCHLLQGPNSNHLSSATMSSAHPLSGATLASVVTPSYARVAALGLASSGYVDPAKARGKRILGAVNHSDISSSPITPQETQHLAGYTGGTRVAFGRP